MAGLASVKGRVVRGLRAASGASRRPPRGTIALQLPHFRKALPGFDGFFDRRPRIGTLNVRVPRRAVEVLRPEHHLLGIRWTREIAPENFYLSPCRLRFAGREYRGLVYIPDPATKPHGLPTGHVLEILTERVPLIRYGAPVRLDYNPEAVALVPIPRVSARAGRRSLRPA